MRVFRDKSPLHIVFKSSLIAASFTLITFSMLVALDNEPRSRILLSQDVDPLDAMADQAILQSRMVQRAESPQFSADDEYELDPDIAKMFEESKSIGDRVSSAQAHDAYSQSPFAGYRKTNPENQVVKIKFNRSVRSNTKSPVPEAKSAQSETDGSEMFDSSKELRLARIRREDEIARHAQKALEDSIHSDHTVPLERDEKTDTDSYEPVTQPAKVPVEVPVKIPVYIPIAVPRYTQSSPPASHPYIARGAFAGPLSPAASPRYPYSPSRYPVPSQRRIPHRTHGTGWAHPPSSIRHNFPLNPVNPTARSAAPAPPPSPVPGPTQFSWSLKVPGAVTVDHIVLPGGTYEMSSPLSSAAPAVSAEPPPPIPAAPAVSTEPESPGKEGDGDKQEEEEEEDALVINTSRDMSNGVDPAATKQHAERLQRDVIDGKYSDSDPARPDEAKGKAGAAGASGVAEREAADADDTLDSAAGMSNGVDAAAVSAAAADLERRVAAGADAGAALGASPAGPAGGDVEGTLDSAADMSNGVDAAAVKAAAAELQRRVVGRMKAAPGPAAGTLDTTAEMGNGVDAHAVAAAAEEMRERAVAAAAHPTPQVAAAGGDADGTLDTVAEMSNGVDAAAAAAAASAEGGDVEGTLDTVADMSNGVDAAAVAAAAAEMQRRAVSGAGVVGDAEGGTLDTAAEMGNGVDAQAVKAAAGALRSVSIARTQAAATADGTLDTAAEMGNGVDAHAVAAAAGEAQARAVAAMRARAGPSSGDTLDTVTGTSAGVDRAAVASAADRLEAAVAARLDPARPARKAAARAQTTRSALAEEAPAALAARGGRKAARGGKAAAAAAGQAARAAELLAADGADLRRRWLLLHRMQGLVERDTAAVAAGEEGARVVRVDAALEAGLEGQVRRARNRVRAERAALLGLTRSAVAAV